MSPNPTTPCGTTTGVKKPLLPSSSVRRICTSSVSSNSSNSSRGSFVCSVHQCQCSDPSPPPLVRTSHRVAPPPRSGQKQTGTSSAASIHVPFLSSGLVNLQGKPVRLSPLQPGLGPSLASPSSHLLEYWYARSLPSPATGAPPFICLGAPPSPPSHSQEAHDPPLSHKAIRTTWVCLFVFL